MREVPFGTGTGQAPNVVLGLMRIADLDDDRVRALIRAARDAGIDEERARRQAAAEAFVEL